MSMGKKVCSGCGRRALRLEIELQLIVTRENSSVWAARWEYLAAPAAHAGTTATVSKKSVIYLHQSSVNRGLEVLVGGTSLQRRRRGRLAGSGGNLGGAGGADDAEGAHGGHYELLGGKW